MTNENKPVNAACSPLLSVNELKVSFGMYQKGLKKNMLTVIQNLSLDVCSGEIVAIVGSSGSGKSLLAHAILGILPNNAIVEGQIIYDGCKLTKSRQKQLRGKEIALIPQSVEHLDPLMRVGKQVTGVHGSEKARQDVFKRYGLGEQAAMMYPFQLSGGMARRMLIGTAVTITPRLIVADEPTPGLSADLAIETLQNFRELADKGAAVLLITHDVDLALNAADKIAVFYAGTTVEIAPAEDFKTGADALRHPYSKAFIDALPQNEFKPIAGKQPYAGSLPGGCLFADRCTKRTDECRGEIAMRDLHGGKVRCVNAT